MKIILLTGIILIFSLQQNLCAQKPGSEGFIKPTGKNSIKGITYGGGLLFVAGIAGISAGYERIIAGHHVIEVTGYYNYQILDEMGRKSRTFCIMPGYRYSVASPNRFFNHAWFGVYFIYYQRTYWGGDEWEGDYYIEYHNGIGASVGRKFYLSPHWFFDIGLGVSYNLFAIEPKSSTNTEPLYFMPRPILQVGATF